MSENTLYNINRPCAHSDWSKTHALKKEIDLGLLSPNKKEKNQTYHLDILVPNMRVFNFFKAQS